jgi:competence protein ComEC
VLRLRHGRRAVLLTGDAEAEAERELLAHHRDALRADLLKVGHHGSRTSTSPAFVAAVAPSLATISCGVRNRYGHPHPETLDTLARAGVVALRLDRSGGVIWASDGEAVRVTAFSEPR